MNVKGAGRPRRCVLLFARAPRAEAAVKRLRGGEALFALAQGRVRNAVAALPGVELVLVPPAAQAGADFGERLECAFRDAARRGCDEIVAVPGDVPGVTATDLAAAFRGLAESDTVLGPSADGGVWLIGLRADTVPSDFFEGVPWLTPRVFESLLSNAPGSAILARKDDVDRRADARRLKDTLCGATRREKDSILLIVLEALLGRRSAALPRQGSPRGLEPSFSGPPPSRAPPLFPLSL
ncbi:MAG TPA: DUF2064 domain-containing protein [Thermoanaerobaculia bacterium]|nr:DUF2064 domain-containing protein [Thermoanaerobaculia bacterium]